MSEVIDHEAELLNDDSEEYSDYDITEEAENTLLDVGEDYEDKKNETLDDEDILTIGFEEDLQDPDEKIEEESKSEEKKPSLLNTPNSKVKFQDKPPVKPNSAPAGPKNTNNVITKVENKRSFQRNGRQWRGTNRDNFRGKPNYNRRNGTVLINPRYEGTVHVNENNARLAWDNFQTQSRNNNSNYITPWANRGTFSANTYSTSSDPLLLSNLVSGLASYAQSSATVNLLPSQQPTQNFFQPPPTSYQPQLSFEPPPSLTLPIQSSLQNYNSQGHQLQSMPQWDTPHFSLSENQGTARRTFPSSQTGISSSSRFSQDYYFNKQQNNYFGNKSNTYPKSNFSGKSDVQHNNNLTYVKSSFQDRNPNYSGYASKQGTYGSSFGNKFENKKYNNRTNFGQEKRPNSFNTYQQNDFNKSSSNVTRDGQNKNVVQINRRPATHDENLTQEVPEKKAKLTEVPKNEPKDSPKEENKPPQATEDEAESEEDRIYREKIEQQKKERERVLKMKEERRKQMLLERKKKEEATLPPVKQEKVEKPVIQPIVDNIVVKKPANLGTFSSNFPQKSNFDSNQFSHSKKVHFSANPAPLRPQFAHPGSQVVRNQKAPPQRPQFSKPNQDDFSDTDSVLSVNMTNLTFKVANNLQEKAPVAKVPRAETSSGFMSNRVVVVKNNQKNVPSSNVVVKTEPTDESSTVGAGLSSFFNNRKVLKKDNTLLDTRLVVVNNLSATINQNKLIALTHGIGEIQKLRVDTQERQATILFKSVASAHAFFKKYQRRILDDLSVIEVKLEPMI